MIGQQKQLRFRTKLACTTLTLCFLAASCKLEEALLPTSPTGVDDAVSSAVGAILGNSENRLTAPVVSDPLPGSTVSTAQPTLTVLNSAHLGTNTKTYLFQIALDTAFSVLTAQSEQIPEGSDGHTSWPVDTPLTNGQYFWRVRATSGVDESPFSTTAKMVIGNQGEESAGESNEPPPTPPPTPEGTLISDPLTGGGSMGEVHGGQFGSEGWTVAAPGNFIRYEVQPLSEGWIEFDTVGLQEENPSHDQFMLFGMWDPSAGDYRTNPYRVHLQKLHPNPHNPPYVRLRWISNGEQHDEGSNFLGWNPQHVYHWRIQWGPTGNGHLVSVILDGEIQVQVNYNNAYLPSIHFIELGIGERGESITGVTYSNFQIGN